MWAREKMKKEEAIASVAHPQQPPPYGRRIVQWFVGLRTVHEPVKGYLLERLGNCSNPEPKGTGLLTIGMR